MFTEWLDEAELALIHWYRSLNQWQTAALNLYLTTGDGSQLAAAFSRQRFQAAA